MNSRWIKKLGLYVLSVLSLLLLTAPMATHAGGGVFVVNTTDDLDDGVCDAAHCSLREAINMVNTYAGVQYIYFDIPGSGPHEIGLCSMLPSLSDNGTVIDGTTEPDYAAGIPSVVIKPGALNVTTYPGCTPPPIGIWIAASDITVRGLSVIGFMSPTSSVAAGIVAHMGSNVTIEQNFIGLDPSGAPVGNRDGILMGSEASQIYSNRISGNVNGIHVFRNDHVIRLNFIGTDPTGTSTSLALGNSVGILVDYPSGNVQIGGPNPMFMNLISGNDTGVQVVTDGNFVTNNRIGSDASGVLGLGNDTGIWVTGNSNLIEGNQVSDSQIGVLLLGSSNQVSGNFIGTDSSGDLALGNDTGVHINGSDNVIGGEIPIMLVPGSTAGNIISGNDTGIFLGPNAQNNYIKGNKIGAGNSPDSSLPNTTGILLDGADNNIIGGIYLPMEANWVMHNIRDGIQFVTTASDNLVQNNYIAWNERGITAGATTGTSIQNTFHYNNIYYNDQLGIDLFPWGVTPNDPGDADLGANNLQNFPVITSATTSTVQGTACLGCTVEIFESEEDPSGYGEGISPIGEGFTDSSGNFSISVDPLSTAGVCDYVTATATDSNGNTSEFAQNFLIGPCFTFSPHLLLFLGVVFVAGGAAAGGSIGRGRGKRPGLGTAAGAALGGVIGAGLLLTTSFIPIFRFPPEEEHMVSEGLTALRPSCNAYLDPQALEPQDGAIVLDENFDFAWAWLNEPSNGDFRWVLELNGPDDSGQQTTKDTSLPFTAFGLTFDEGDRFSWRLSGERFEDASAEWEAFCTPSAWLTFQIGLSPLLAPPWTPDTPEGQPPTPTSTPESPAGVCLYTAVRNSNCRASDYPESLQIDILMQGESAELLALNPEFTHGKFDLDHGQCWIWLGLLDGPENPYGTCGVPVIDPPPPPTSTPPICSPDLGQEDCEASGGTWSGGVTGATGCTCPD
jgi:CSLREA domain-containing protein